MTHACCKHCAEDPLWHEENEPNTHETSCPTCERDAPQSHAYALELEDLLTKIRAQQQFTVMTERREYRTTILLSDIEEVFREARRSS